MTRYSTLFPRACAGLLLGGALALGGCHSGSTRETVSTTQMQGQFDTTVEAYKGGQFLVDGAVLSAIDAGSHFAYLKDQGKLPKTVLLMPSDDSKIRKKHLEYMARMQLDYGFAVYYDDGGTLKKINPVETGARELEDYHGPRKLSDEQHGRDAANTGGGIEGQQQQQQRRDQGQGY